MTEVTDASLIAEALTDYYGPRCPDFEPECHCCKAWAQFDAIAARPEPEGVALETTAKEREAYAKAAETELVWPEAGFVERLLRDFDRLSAESASLKAKFAEAEGMTDVGKILRAHNEGWNAAYTLKEAEKAEAVKAEREAWKALCLEREIIRNAEGYPIGDCPRFEDGPAIVRARGGST